MLNCIIAFLILMGFLIVVFIYEKLKERNTEENQVEDDGKRYVLNVITVHEDGGVSSHWHGWSSKWLFTYNEAIEEKERIKHKFTEVEILEHENEQEEIKSHIEKSMNIDELTK